MQLSSFTDTFDDHARHAADLTVGESFDDFVQPADAAVALSIVEVAEAFYEEELVAVFTLWESRFRDSGIGQHHVVAVLLEAFVGGAVERVLYVFAEAGVLLIVGVCEQDGPFALRIERLQTVEACVGL